MSTHSAKCRLGPCRNTVDLRVFLDGYCHVHEHLGSVRTPGGSLAFRGHGVLALRSRIERELVEPPPPDSVGLDGFPYLTRRDVDRYREWRAGDEDARPPYSEVLERYPVVVRDVLGADLTGREVGVYDGSGDVHTFVPGSDGVNATYEEHADPASGTRTRLYQIEYGLPFAVISERTYQVVVIDSHSLDEVARSLH